MRSRGSSHVNPPLQIVTPNLQMAATVVAPLPFGAPIMRDGFSTETGLLQSSSPEWSTTTVS
jgi:hypothetical protein